MPSKSFELRSRTPFCLLSVHVDADAVESLPEVDLSSSVRCLDALSHPELARRTSHAACIRVPHVFQQLVDRWVSEYLAHEAAVCLQRDEVRMQTNARRCDAVATRLRNCFSF